MYVGLKRRVPAWSDHADFPSWTVWWGWLATIARRALWFAASTHNESCDFSSSITCLYFSSLLIFKNPEILWSDHSFQWLFSHVLHEVVLFGAVFIVPFAVLITEMSFFELFLKGKSIFDYFFRKMHQRWESAHIKTIVDIVYWF